MEHDLADIRNLLVLDAEGRVLGRVHDLTFDSQTWQVTALVVRLERAVAEQLGRYTLLHPSDLAVRPEQVHHLNDSVLLRVTVDELQQGLGLGVHPAAPPY